MAFIDFKKAFDSVWRPALWFKIKQLNINGKFLNIIQNMYDNAKACVEINGERSNFFACSMGVKQGENLSPILFSLFIQDLYAFLNDEGFEGLKHFDIYGSSEFLRTLGSKLKLLILLYADDTVVLADSAEGLQLGLDSLLKYCNRWGLTINMSKTNIVVFTSFQSN